MSPGGEQRLKGLDEAEFVYELQIDGVEITPLAEPSVKTTGRRPERRTAGRRLQGFARA